MLLLTMLIAATAAGSTAPFSANPLANAEKSLLQCYRPNVQDKTCQSIASYRRTGPGTYDNKALVPVSGDVTLETHTPVVIKGEAVCGSVRREDILQGTLRAGNQIIPAEKAKPILDRIAQAMAPLFDKEICTTYEKAGADFTAKASIDGHYSPDLDQTVKWIGPAEGYTVKP